MQNRIDRVTRGSGVERQQQPSAHAVIGDGGHRRAVIG